MKTLRATLFLLITFSVNTFAQHDPGRGAVRKLAKDDVKGATKELGNKPKKSNSPISKAEHSFVLAMAACQQGDVDAAFTHVKEAVAAGIPIERVAAGPRDIFKPLHNNPEFTKWLKSKCSPLLQGPLQGSVTENSTGFWVRTAEAADVQIVAFQTETKALDPVIGKARTTAADDYTAVVTVSGLLPNTRYTYHVVVDGNKIGLEAKFKTFPKKGTAGKFSIAFGGGAGFTPQYERMWTTIGKHSVDALLLLGDNVYIDDPEHSLTQHYCYYRRQSQADWRKLTASTPVYTIYDDHDFGMDDCAHGPEIETPSWKRKVWEVYKQNWCNPSYGGGAKQPGCYYDFSIGDVHFIMLDCRYYRDPKGGSMIGPVQKKWLKEKLKSSKGTFKGLVSSVPWSPGVKPGSKDTWDGFPEEREEIFSYLEEQNIEGLILMSADRHRTDMRKIKRPLGKGYDLTEVMSSRLTNVHTHKLLEQAKGSEFIMGYNKECSFGLMQFNTTATDPTIKFSIISIDNKDQGSREIHLSELKKK